jgi:hypothetical protein
LGCSAQPRGSVTIAPSDIGRPQNFVSRSFGSCRYFTCAVSAGGSIGGISWSMTTRISPLRAGSTYIFTGRL